MGIKVKWSCPLIGTITLHDVLTSYIMTISHEHLTHPKGMEREPVNYMLKDYTKYDI